MEESKWEEEGAPPRHRTWYMRSRVAMDPKLGCVFFIEVGGMFWGVRRTPRSELVSPYTMSLGGSVNSSAGDIGWYDPSQRVLIPKMMYTRF